MGRKEVMLGELRCREVKKWIKWVEERDRGKEMYGMCMGEVFKGGMLE